MRNILILGGAGFIGSKTAKELHKLKNNVLIVDNLSTGRKENLDKKINFIKIDIGNFKRMDEVFKSFKPDILYNFAFNVLVPKSIEDPSLEVKSIKDHISVYVKEIVIFQKLLLIFVKRQNYCLQYLLCQLIQRN